MLKELKAFLAKDSIITLAVAVIIGGAFSNIITSLVDDIFMPIIVALTGQADVSDIALKIGNTTLGVGNFLQAVINFVLIGTLLFFVLKGLEKATRKNIITPAPAEPTGPTETELLQEILVELRNK